MTNTRSLVGIIAIAVWGVVGGPALWQLGAMTFVAVVFIVKHSVSRWAIRNLEQEIEERCKSFAEREKYLLNASVHLVELKEKNDTLTRVMQDKMDLKFELDALKVGFAARFAGDPAGFRWRQTTGKDRREMNRPGEFNVRRGRERRKPVVDTTQASTSQHPQMVMR